jgi:hypothetical protein
MYSAKSSAIRLIFPNPFTCMGSAIQIVLLSSLSHGLLENSTNPENF